MDGYPVVELISWLRNRYQARCLMGDGDEKKTLICAGTFLTFAILIDENEKLQEFRTGRVSNAMKGDRDE